MLLTQIEKRLKLAHRIGLEVLIEEVEAIVNIEEIALSSPRLEALIFGPGDYSASQGMDSGVIEGQLADYPGDPWHYVRNRIAIAARWVLTGSGLFIPIRSTLRIMHFPPRQKRLPMLVALMSPTAKLWKEE